jgi:Histidine kinase-, DNA gyrase B-, and HSP90-like ATPase
LEITMTTTIQAQVSPSTLGKVSRLFNSSLTDCLNELLQNARRAGATTVKMTLSDDRLLTLEDDGTGIAHPQTLLTLGESDWSEETKQQEDPAGMGVRRDTWNDILGSAKRTLGRWCLS